ncbi:Phenylacetic acid degradation operon negative regulatory protein paaX [Pseudonocardia sp. Ae168_Ps1]|uniref:PaaX family transcriptional regulator n=1 Tax=unclassified Pseudonocardia TaxID=2619320 RepID=UPI0001FFED62|nr:MULTISPECIES: PaaX family transcriptional regulator C-terminal domain-containing protein [unclassified Pseudonocardia]ALE74068.1 PaaX family transcriptional regulator [Pseudonocardia sp. EC080625-04]ALL77478.1 PaaX family transcriptional regulator [Pseudonocardia sp. EC080610-09]ALL80394.1 PaaX family transcriptional regulator [Pseudonocardia sp. EC080619-01]OLL71204.1 Phenylacetic acid degradation operon negative regulatory protein paaX [Pseudonocardia sp. Ae168_Ps1]OLL77244.1 Phenylacetic
MATPFRDPGPAEAADGSALRRRELGQTSARSLLLTVLGEFVLPAGEPVWTRALLEVLGTLGVEAKSARQALARTAAEGLLTSDRDGRRVRWSLTPSGERLLSDGAARIYGLGATGTEWDGRWLVLLASVPESRRRLRHRLRTRLAWAGLGSPAPGVWLSPDPGKEEQVAAVLDELGLAGMSSSFVGRYGGIGSAAEVVAQAWDLDRVEAAYQEFLDDFGAELDRTDPGDVLARQVRLVHAWRRFPFLDPELPAELLPDRWAGTRATELFAALHARWDGAARAAWAELAGTP